MILERQQFVFLHMLSNLVADCKCDLPKNWTKINLAVEYFTMTVRQYHIQRDNTLVKNIFIKNFRNVSTKEQGVLDRINLS